MNEMKESRVKVTVWRAPGNGKPAPPKRLFPKINTAFSKGMDVSGSISSLKAVGGGLVTNLRRPFNKQKDRSSIWLAAERKARISNESAKKSGRKRKPFRVDWISKVRNSPAGKKAQAAEEHIEKPTDVPTSVETDIRFEIKGREENVITIKKSNRKEIVQVKPDASPLSGQAEIFNEKDRPGASFATSVQPVTEELTPNMEQTSKDDNEPVGDEKVSEANNATSFPEDRFPSIGKAGTEIVESASIEEDGASFSDVTSLQEGKGSTEVPVEDKNIEPDRDEKVEASVDNSSSSQEASVLKTEPETASGKKESRGQDASIGSETDGKPTREGWVSPKYNSSKKVKLDYRVAAKNRCVGLFPDLPYLEHYKMLRTQINQRCAERGWNTIMVTSVNPEEGKTVTAINLSVVLAREFEQTVLLVDADLRKQHVHQYMGYPSAASLVDYLEGGVPLSDVIVWPGIEKLTVISGGNTVQDSTEILGSPRMGSLVSEMKNRYPKRYIIFDVPPVLDHADAATFAPLVDGILVVVAPGRTDLKDVMKITELLPKEKIIGYAMNRFMQ